MRAVDGRGSREIGRDFFFLFATKRQGMPREIIDEGIQGQKPSQVCDSAERKKLSKERIQAYLSPNRPAVRPGIPGIQASNTGNERIQQKDGSLNTVITTVILSV